MRLGRLFALVGACLAPLPTMAAASPATASVSACFTPGPTSCAQMIAATIGAAHATVRVQAYWLTSAPIMKALVDAKGRGVDVAAILDKTQDRTGDPRGRYSSAVFLAHAGIPVWIDEAPAIAHNKVIVIDGATVITGSFNFTKAADTRNAENVVVLQSAEVAGWFTGNWEARRAVSRAFDAE